MRKTTKGKGLAGGTAVAAVVAGLALLQSLGLAAVWGALPAAFAVFALGLEGPQWCSLVCDYLDLCDVPPVEGDPGR